jgi:hypothetical protein
MNAKNISKKLVVVGCVAALAAFQARAVTTYSFQYADVGFTGGPLIGSGTLTASRVGNSSTWDITSGSFIVTAVPSGEGVATGTYSLLTAGGGSVLGFAYNNTLFNVGSLPETEYGNGGPQLLNGFGLGGIAFYKGGDSGITSGDQDLLITGGSPAIGGAVGVVGGPSADVGFGFSNQSYFTLTAVPEMSTFAVASVGLLGLVFIGRKVVVRRMV